jgi:hypothetical protein
MMNTVSDKSGDGFSRRRFLASTSSLGAALLLGLSRHAAAEPPPETTRIRLTQDPAICLAPQYLAEELLRLEGFAEIEYAKYKSPLKRDGKTGNVVADWFSHCTTHRRRAPCRDVMQRSALPLMTRHAPRCKGGSGNTSPPVAVPNGRVLFCCELRGTPLRPPPDRVSDVNGMSASGRCAFFPLALRAGMTNHDPAAGRFFPPAVAL